MSTFSDTVHDTQYTLSSHATKESSEHESDLTEMTANTSLTPERSMTSTPPPPQAMNNAKVSSNNQLQQQQQQQEIRQSYMAVPETVPDVAAEMNKWFADADRYGFLEDKTEIDLKSKQKEVERSSKWHAMAESFASRQEILHRFDIHSTKFVKRVYKGIPDCWRRDAWYCMLTDELRTANDDDLLRMRYKEEFLTESSSHERQIDLDIPRTMYGHIMFRQRYGQGQRALFNVLRAFSVYDEQVGYCQGMANVVAILLIYFEEEKAFTALLHMFQRDGLHDLFVPGFPALMESFYVQERLLEKNLPKLAKHLHAKDVSSATYATRWYITLFTGGVVPYHTLLRILDVYFLVGYDIFYFVALALLKTHQDRLLKGNMEECLAILGSTIPVADDDRFIRQVRKLYTSNASKETVKQFKEQYRAQKSTALWYDQRD
ncbi:hypothetical protein LRAMOSA00137 [Lichtheimia ramosa]|uniref:Rab-GAP TBC domain-containing protein n=1 Tax=Lichtheimia ramosa TaxID=688394 RepID=A0A077W9G4_9FUNG|nr:hypothetical protein LRAMOSA00137 [Lichtheimia ramosa]